MSIFPTKILLATDGSEDANLALRAAVDIAEKTGSELHVVHVGTPLYLPRYYEGIDMEGYIEEEEKELERRAQKLLDDQVRKIKATGGSVAGAHLTTGRADEEIVALADELGVGLIAMGSRGLGGVRRALMGAASPIQLCGMPAAQFWWCEERRTGSLSSPRRESSWPPTVPQTQSWLPVPQPT